MTKTIMILAIATAMIGSIFTTPIAQAQQEAKLVETVELDEVKVKPGETIVLLDVTDLGTIDTVHVAANLPCNGNGGPNDGAGNDIPDVKIVAGDASTGIFGDVIESTGDDTGFVGPEKTCVFHDTFSPNEAVPVVTDIVLQNVGVGDIDLKDVVVTIVINDPDSTATILSQLGSILTEVTNIEDKLDDSISGLAALQSLLDQILSPVLGIDTEVTNIEAKLDPGGSFFTFVNNGLTSIQTDISNAVTTITGAISSAQTTIVGEIDANEVKIDAIQSDVSMVKTDVGMIKTTVGGIDTEVTNIEAKLDDGTSGLAAIQSNIGLIKTETDKVQFVNDNQYVPFKARGPASTVICDPAGGGAEFRQITIENSGTSGVFLITSISVQFNGVDDATDIISYSTVTLDGAGTTKSIGSGDITGTTTSRLTYEVLGIPHGDGANANFIRELAAESSGPADVVVDVKCDAQGTKDIIVGKDQILVSGWKKPSETITVTFGPG